MNFYEFNNIVYISKFNIKVLLDITENTDNQDFIKGLKEISEIKAASTEGFVFVLNNLKSGFSRSSFLVTHEEFLFIDKEDISLLKTPNKPYNIDTPLWLKKLITNSMVISLNVSYNNCSANLNGFENKRWRVNIIGLGDVGGTLAIGLRLLGGDCIESIGLYDRDENKIKRWQAECGQILSPCLEDRFPKVIPLKEDELFDCDFFVFCVSVGVPTVGAEAGDVRLAQFKGNSKVVSFYSKLAKTLDYKGIFAVVSDPVDLLCRVVFETGLSPNQVRGYGLGVMNARAAYYSEQSKETSHYLSEGRAFGPHGEGLVIADSIQNYNVALSDYLTKKTIKANLEVRDYGFKPYIAPALSSGSLSIIATIKSQWHYSATFLGGTFMGTRNRLIRGSIELETYEMNDILYKKLENTYNDLNSQYNSLK